MKWRGRWAAARRGGSEGFLLVEALGTLAVSALILVGLASILGLMLRAGDRTAARAERIEMEGRALAAIERDLRLIARATWAGAGEEEPPRFVFQGGPDTVLFARDMNGADGLSATRLVALQSVATDNGGRLLRAEAPLPLNARNAAEARLGPAEELYGGRALVRFAYAGRPEVGGPEIVAESWPTEARLPAAIRVELIDRATGAARASLRVPLLIEAEPGCAAPKEGFCSLVKQEEREEEADSGDDASEDDDASFDEEERDE